MYIRHCAQVKRISNLWYVCTFVCACGCAYVHVWVLVCVCMYVHMCVYACVLVCMSVCACVCAHVYLFEIKVPALLKAVLQWKKALKELPSNKLF